MKNTLMSVVLLLSATQTFAQSDLFGRNADTGAIVGGIVGAVVGHHNGNAWKGAAIGAGVGLVAGAIADNHTYHTSGNHQPVYQETYSSYDDYYDRDFYPSYGQVVVRQPPSRIIVMSPPPPPPRVIVIHRPTPVYTYPNHRYTEIRSSPPCVVQNNYHRPPSHNFNNRPPANNYRPPVNNHPRDNRRDDRRDHDRRR
jgi:hypothetical protein